MFKNDFVKVFLLTAICVAAFVGFFYIAIQCPLVGIYGTIFFPKSKACVRRKKKRKEIRRSPEQGLLAFLREEYMPYYEEQLA